MSIILSLRDLVVNNTVHVTCPNCGWSVGACFESLCLNDMIAVTCKMCGKIYVTAAEEALVN